LTRRPAGIDTAPMRSLPRWILSLALIPACTGDDGDPADTDPGATGSTTATSTTATTAPEETTTTGPDATTTTGPGESTGPDPDSGSEGSESSGTTGEEDLGPMVDVSDPQLYEFEFGADEADAAADAYLGTQLAYLDTGAETLRGRLVVFLHGAGGPPSTCGSRAHGTMLAELGFHVVSPCYAADYGVGNCDADIGGCRLEAFEGVDHTPIIDIQAPNSTEVRVTRALEYLQDMHPGGDWQYYLDGDVPRWDRIIITGSSHGASSSGLIGMNRLVSGVVMLSGPLDSGQAWLLGEPITPIERFFAFTHTGDGQHAGHLESFEDMGLVGEPVVVDGADAPYGGSHRLVTSAPTGNGHGSTTAGGSSPQDGGEWVFQPVWETMYLAYGR